MKRYSILWLLLALLWLATGCGEREYVAKTFDDNFCNTLGEDRFIEISGVLKAPELVIDEGNQMLVLMVPDIEENEPWIQVRIEKGDGANEIAPLPETFALADFQVTTDDGRILTHGDPMTVRGQALNCTTLSADTIH